MNIRPPPPNYRSGGASGVILVYFVSLLILDTPLHLELASKSGRQHKQNIFHHLGEKVECSVFTKLNVLFSIKISDRL